MGYPHLPLDRDGRVMRYGHIARPGCDSKKEPCAFPHQSRIKPDGLHWAEAYEMARRGGHASRKRIEHQVVEGYLQALREHNAAEIKRPIEEIRTNFGRSHHAQERECIGGPEGDVLPPPGLVNVRRIDGGTSMVVGENPVAHPLEETMACLEAKRKRPAMYGPEEYRRLTKRANVNLTTVNDDILRFDCAELGKHRRGFLYESDGWTQSANLGHVEWKDDHEPTAEAGEVDGFLSKAEAEGGRAAYFRSIAMASESPLNEAYDLEASDLARHGPSFMRRETPSDEKGYGGQNREEIIMRSFSGSADTHGRLRRT